MTDKGVARVDVDFTLEWMEKAEKNCLTQGRKDAAALWKDARAAIQQTRSEAEALRAKMERSDRFAAEALGKALDSLAQWQESAMAEAHAADEARKSLSTLRRVAGEMAEALRHVKTSGVELDDERLDYRTVQIQDETMDEIDVALAAFDQIEKESGRAG